MSLKAKIEAVIYASEEPVTLVQLIGLLGQEGQAELDHLESQQQELGLEGGSSAAEGQAAGGDLGPVDEDPDEEARNAELLEAGQPAAGALGDAEDTGAAKPRDVAERGEDGVAETQAANGKEEKQAALEAGRAAKLAERRLREYFRELLDELMSDYANGDRGLEVREVAGGFRLATKPEYHDAVRGFVKNLKPPVKLTLQALETLAVVAYKQPVTAPEVSEIRGVDSAGVMGSLIARKLVTTAGRKQVIGRPILYKTTKDFLLRFGLKDINELPSIEEFEKMAGELNEAVQEEMQMENGDEEQDGPAATASAAEASETAGGSATSVDERRAVPEPTHVHHDTPEDLMSDRSTSPEGHKQEPPSPAAGQAAAEQAAAERAATEHGFRAEPERDEHSDQADGTPEEGQ